MTPCGAECKGSGRAGHATRWLAVLTAGLALLAGAPRDLQAADAKIAVVVSTSGALEPYGHGALEGARLAVEEANAEGNGPSIEIEVFDDASKPGEAKAAAKQAVAGDALVVVGPSTTAMGIIVNPVFAEGGIACIGTTAAGDSLTDSATFFRGSFSTGESGGAIASYLRHVLGAPPAIVLLKEDSYGQQVAGGFRHAATRLGLAATYRSFKDVAGAEEAAREAASDPANPAIVLATIDEAAAIIKILRRSVVRGPVLGTNAIAGEFFARHFENEPEEQRRPGYFSDGVYAVTPLLFDSANAETLAFQTRFRSRYDKEPTYISGQGYEAALLAIAAVRSVQATIPDGSTADRRAGAQAYLSSLDSPIHALPGLDGALWFTPERGRQQALRMGVFHAGRLESAPVQLVPVPNPDGTEISSGAVVEVAQGIHARLQKVVYTGVYLNSISSIDIRQSTFTADLYLWMRFAGDTSPGAADPARIEFPELVRGHFEPEQPVARGDLDDGTTYRLWHISGDFQNRFDLRDYPVDHQTLAVRFFHATAASDRLVYIKDTRAQGGRAPRQAPPSPGAATAGGIGQAAATSLFPAIATPHDPLSVAAPDAFTGLTRWAPLNVNKRRDILVTESALGDPRLVGLARHRELSGFMVTVDVARRVWAVLLKTLLPLGLMTLILLASLYFSAALVQEKITVAITAALSGAVLLSSIDEQLGSIGYTVRIEYLFYAFFTLCLLCIVSIMLADRCRLAKRDTLAVSVEQVTRILFLLSMLATVFTGWSISHLP